MAAGLLVMFAKLGHFNKSSYLLKLATEGWLVCDLSAPEKFYTFPFLKLNKNMIEDLEWRLDPRTGEKALFAYDGYVWFRVPVSCILIETGGEEHENKT